MARIYEKYAWVILLSLELLWLVVGVVAVFQPEGIFEADAWNSQKSKDGV